MSLSISKEDILAARKLQLEAIEKSQEVASKVGDVLADELMALNPKMRKAVEVSVYPVLAQALTSAWMDVFEFIDDTAEHIKDDPHLLAITKEFASGEKVKMISEFVKNICDMCKERLK